MAVYTIDPFDAQMPFPLDLRNVKPSLTERNSIPSNSRTQGLLCYTVAEGVLWMLAGGTSNSDWKQIYPSSGSAGSAGTSLVTGTSDVTITWSATATDSAGNPVPQTWAQLYGNTPHIQVWLDTGSGWSLEVVPVMINMSGSNISNIVISTGSINSRIIIK